jgi:hypothetical protein
MTARGYSLIVLGQADLRDSGGKAIEALLAQPKRLALLAYLTLASPHGFHRRDLLLSLFWPDLPEARARNALRQALFQLREWLPDVVLSRADGSLGIDRTHLSCDAIDFETACGSRDAATASALYVGDVLPAFSIGDADPFNEWLEGYRVALRQRHDSLSTPLETSARAERSDSRSRDITVAVTPFQNLTGDGSRDHIGQIAAEAVISGLTETRLATVISAQSEDEPSFRVIGSFRADAAGLAFHAQLQDAFGRVVGVLSDPAGEQDVDVAIDRLRRRAGGLLASRVDRRVESWADVVSHAPDIDAHQKYMSGVEHHLRGDYDAALESLMAAAGEDRQFTIPVIWAIQSCCNSERFERAEALVASLNLRRLTLPRAEQLACDYYAAWLDGDRGGAFRILRRVADLVPGSEVLSQLGRDALLCNDPATAVELLDRLDPAKGWMPEWLPYWGRLTEALHVLGEHRQELDAAQRARRFHPQAMSPFLYEARAQAALDDVDSVRATAEESLGLRRDAFTSSADVFLAAGRELRAHGHLADAGWFFDRCLSINDATSADATASDRLVRLAALYEASQWSQLDAELEHLPREGDPDLMGLHAASGAHQSDALRARSGIAALRKLTGKFRFGRHLMWAARVAAVLGEGDDALPFLRGAFARGHPYGVQLHADRDLLLLRDHEGVRDALRPRTERAPR